MEQTSHAGPEHERRWLEGLVGEWRYESEAGAPGQPTTRDTGTERVRVLGGGWVACEGQGDAAEGGLGSTLMTLAFDPERGRVVGAVVATMMTFLWVYDGTLGADGVLTLETEGPSLVREGEMGRYRDTIAFDGPDRRVQTSSFLDGHGRWQRFMTTEYERTR